MHAFTHLYRVITRAAAPALLALMVGTGLTPPPAGATASELGLRNQGRQAYNDARAYNEGRSVAYNEGKAFAKAGRGDYNRA